MVIISELKSFESCTSGFLSSLCKRYDRRRLNLITLTRKLHLTLALTFSHFLFLRDCLELNLVPKGLRFRFAVRNSKELNWRKKIELERVKLCMKSASKKTFHLRRQIVDLKTQILPELDHPYLQQVCGYWQDTQRWTRARVPAGTRGYPRAGAARAEKLRPAGRGYPRGLRGPWTLIWHVGRIFAVGTHTGFFMLTSTYKLAVLRGLLM